MWETIPQPTKSLCPIKHLLGYRYVTIMSVSRQLLARNTTGRHSPMTQMSTKSVNSFECRSSLLDWTICYPGILAHYSKFTKDQIWKDYEKSSEKNSRE
ncbi:hypothetical protein TNCV_3193161 [Trichonephila clavipes]|nr:hypothetical protein TNCV_3193161 [Trichonephila clavipes]